MKFFTWKSYVLLALLSIVIGIFAIIFQFPNQNEYAELGMSIQELIEHRGFQSETHFIKSQNGYLLQTIRIINPHLKRKLRPKPVLLHHGFLCSGSFWLVTSNGTLFPNGTYWEDVVHSKDPKAAGNTLGFVLAAEGYDVWLLNVRGNVYSANHTSLNPNDEQFWNFSMDEVIKYDLPAIIDYILTETSRKSVSYIGHSMGNLLMLGLLSSEPRFNQIVKPFIGIAPVGYFTRFDIALIMHMAPYKKQLVRWFPRDIFSNTLRSVGLPKLCTIPWICRYYCYPLYYQIVASSLDQVDLKRLPIYLDNALHGTGTRFYTHLLQQRTSLAYFNYGDSQTNFEHYHQTYPPFYNYSKITNQHMISIYASKDSFLDEQDRQRLKDDLTVEFAEEHEIGDDTWDHMDMNWGKEAGAKVNYKILKILEKY